MNTLTINAALLQQAEICAKSENTSLSECVEDFLRTFVSKVKAKTAHKEQSLASMLKKWEKEYTCPDDVGYDYKAMWHEHLAEKYV